MEGCTVSDTPRKRDLPKPRTITVPAETYQPPKAERERKYDMPGASLETARRAFFRPVNVKREPVDRLVKVVEDADA